MGVAAASLVYRARPSLPARVVPRSIILSACGAEGREGLADVISIHSRLTNRILLSRNGKQLVHDFERARSTLVWRSHTHEREAREGLASSLTAICTKGMHDDVRTSDVL